MKQIDIYFLLGQFGEVFSGGIMQMAATTQTWPNARTQVIKENEWGRVVEDVNRFASEDRVRLACGYSLGANRLTNVLGGVTYQGTHVNGIHGCKFDACAFLDPTAAPEATLTPLSAKNVVKVLHYKNKSFDVVGHADLLLASDPPQIDIREIETSHLLVDFFRDVQTAVMNLFQSEVR